MIPDLEPPNYKPRYRGIFSNGFIYWFGVTYHTPYGELAYFAGVTGTTKQNFVRGRSDQLPRLGFAK